MRRLVLLAGRSPKHLFIDTIRCTINGSAHDPFLRGVSEWFGLEDPDVVPERLIQAFVLLHLYLYAIAFDAADLTIDLEEIAKDRYARGQVEHELSEMIRYDVDLSDARVQPGEYTDLVIASPRATRDTIEQFAKLIPTASLSPAAIMFVGDAKDSALAEWERFEFYSRRTRVVLTGKTHTAEARAREQETITASLRAERDEALANEPSRDERKPSSGDRGRNVRATRRASRGGRRRKSHMRRTGDGPGPSQDGR